MKVGPQNPKTPWTELFVRKKIDMADSEEEFEYEWPSDGEQQNEEDESEILLKNTFYEADDNRKTRP